MVGDSMTTCIDRSGRKYKIPLYMLNDPINLDINRIKSASLVEGKVISLKIRVYG
jgi:hypothetical protein